MKFVSIKGSKFNFGESNEKIKSNFYTGLSDYEFSIMWEG